MNPVRAGEVEMRVSFEKTHTSQSNQFLCRVLFWRTYYPCLSDGDEAQRTTLMRSLRTKSGLQRWDFKRCSAPEWGMAGSTCHICFSRASFKIKLQEKKKCKCSINSIVLINIVLWKTPSICTSTPSPGGVYCALFGSSSWLHGTQRERTKSTYDNLPSQPCHSRSQGDQFGLFLLNYNPTRMKLAEFVQSPGCLNSANFHQFQERLPHQHLSQILWSLQMSTGLCL